MKDLDPPAIVQSADSLDELAAQINAEFGLAEQKSREGTAHYRTVGLKLIEAKSRLKHGEWLKWLNANVKFTVRQADRYMRLAKLDVTSNLDDQWQVISGNYDDDDSETPHNHRAQGTGDNEWYTPEEFVERARVVLGDFDLDPASSDQAQETIKAASYFTKDDDGLTQEWHGRVWLNPPYSQPHIGEFVQKLVDEYRAGRVTEAILLTHNYTDTTWFHTAAEHASAVCFTRKRIAFVDPQGVEAAPTQGQAFTYFGANIGKFVDQFISVGIVLTTVEQ